MRCLWAVVVCAAVMVPGVALGDDPVADYVGTFETLRESLEAAGSDCAAAAGAIEGWHGKHGEALDGLEASIRSAVTAGQLGDDALETHEDALSAVSGQLGATVEQCTDDQSVVTALALLGDHSTPATWLASALKPAATSPISKYPWGPQCRRMIATMDAMCKAHVGRPEVDEMCRTWNEGWASLPAGMPAETFQQMEAGCGQAIPALEAASANFAATAPTSP